MTMIMQHQDMGMMNNNVHNKYKIVNKPKKHTFTFWETLFEVDTKYEPIKPVGRGAYGVVCSSINTKTNEKVAIKKINDVFDSDLDALRTLREVKILRHVRHENIIELKDVTIPSSKSTFKDIYLVYELMDTDLGNIIRSKQPLSDDHCQYFMMQLLRGLHYLHSANILHRDLKPANLLVNANADLKIGDFGLSRTCSNQGDPMTEYVVTRWYRAPELLLHCDDYGPSIDVWSVGCIFAEILGRKVLFPGETPLDQLQKIINVLGTQHVSDLEFILSKEELRFIKSLPYAPGINLESLFPDAEPLALDLLRKILVFNPSKRITVSEAVKHPYFADLYDPELFQPAPFPCDLDMNGYNIGGDKIRKLLWNELLLYHPEAA